MSAISVQDGDAVFEFLFSAVTARHEVVLSDLQRVILEALRDREQYGLELLIRVLTSGHELGRPVQPGTLHPALKDLERLALVTRAHLREPVEGKCRAYYWLTEAGRLALNGA